MKAKTWCWMTGVVLALLMCMPATAAEAEPAFVVPEEAVDACLDYTPVEDLDAGAEPALLLGPADMEPVAPGCKRCKDQPWCACTYNGAQRVSCDPCCYRNNIGVLICTS